MQRFHVGPGAGATEGVAYYYDEDDELTSEVSSVSGETTYGYDANGSQVAKTTGGNTVAYGYDVRKKLVSATPGR